MGKASVGERRFLIAAGTAKYRHLEDADMPSVEDDVRVIVECFTRLGYERVLEDVSENPSSQEFRLALTKWFTSDSRSPHDKVVFYYSGHGETEDKHYLLFSDSRFRQLDATAIKTADLIGLMLKHSAVQQMLVVLDTCYSGRGISDLSAIVGHLERTWDPLVDYGVFFVAASRSKEEAAQGVFASAFTHAITNKALQAGGRNQAYLSPGSVVEVIKQPLKSTHPHQHVVWSASTASGNSKLISNPQYDDTLPVGLDLESQRQRELIEHWLPRAKGTETQSDVWYFTGRDMALRELVQWITSPTSDGRVRVVTGSPGTGKSALLARLVTLADPLYRQKAEQSGSLTGVSKDTIPPEEIIDVAVHARGKTLDHIIQSIAGATGVDADSAGVLVDKLAKRENRLVIVVDALDEAADPRAIARDLLSHLTGHEHIWLLVGSRPDTRPDTPGARVRSLGNAAVEIDLDELEYMGAHDIESYVTRRLLAVEEPTRHTPYRDRPGLAGTVAEAVAQRAGTLFLLARIATSNLIEATQPINVSVPGWQDRLPANLDDAFNEYLERFDDLHDTINLNKQKVIALLRPLAYAEGEGLPWDFLWAPMANAISGRAQHSPIAYNDDDVELLLEHAGAYVTEAQENERSVYRVYHQTLVDYLRDEKRTIEIQRRITEKLVELTPEYPQTGGKDWLNAHPYIRTHLATHAAAAGVLAQVMKEPIYLLAADSLHLLRALAVASEELPPEVVNVYRRAAHNLKGSTYSEAASYLEMTARQAGVDDLAHQICQVPVDRTWYVPWANWQREVTHGVIHVPDRLTSLSRFIHRWPLAIGKLNEQPIIFSGDMDGSLRLWGFRDSAPIREPLFAHRGGVKSLALCQVEDRLLVVTGGGDGWIRLWDPAVPGQKCQTQFRDDTISTYALATDKLGGRPILVSGHSDGTVRAWDPINAKVIGHPLIGRDPAIYAVAIGDFDGSQIVAAGGSTGTVQVWSLETGAPLCPPLVDHERAIAKIAIVKLKGQITIVSTDRKGIVKVRTPDGTILKDFKTGHSIRENYGSINAVAVGNHDDEPVVVAGDFEGVIRVLSLETETLIGEPLSGHNGEILGLAMATLEGKRVIVSSGQDGTIRIWDADFSWMGTKSLTVPSGHTRSVAVGELAGRSVVISGGYDGTVGVWDPLSGTALARPFRAHDGSVNAVAIAELDGEPVIVSAGHDRTIRVWDLSTRQLISKLPIVHEESIHALAIGKLEDRAVVVAGGGDSKVTAWDLSHGGALYSPLTGHSDSVIAVAVGELDGRQVIASGGIDETVRLWELDNGKLISEFPSGHSGAVSSLAMGHLSGRAVILSGGYEGTVRIWDTRTRTLVGQPMSAHQDGVNSVVLAQLQGQPVVISGSVDGAVRVRRPDGSVLSAINIDSYVLAIALARPSLAILATGKGIMALQLNSRR